MINKPGQPRPAHRPSRREEIIDAAVTVFGRAGYVAASVEDIALESGVAATAIYYHFGGKEELFNQALRTALDRLSEVAYAARQSGGAPATEVDSGAEAGSAAATLRRVIRAGMARAHSHPEETRFLLHQTFRPTTEARKLQQDWEERHVQRTFDYLPQPATPPRTPRDARIRHAAHLLASRVITYTTIVAQESRLAGGPLAEQPMPAIVKAVEDLCVRVVSAAGDSAPAAPATKAAKQAVATKRAVGKASVEESPAGEEPAVAAKKSAVKQAAAEQAATKSAATKSAATKSAATKSAATKSAATKSAATKSAATKSAAVKKPAAKKALVKKAAVQKPAAKPR
ncbi:MAG TPA: TetR family transcriptional regulator [Kineosporiaceae bacterium]|nr:TetR family transcriptional regulator [Kineosporiaceae bacterium]